MGVDLHRHRDLRVPEPFRNDVHGRSGLQEQRRAGMPEPVEFNPPHVRRFCRWAYSLWPMLLSWSGWPAFRRTPHRSVLRRPAHGPRSYLGLHLYSGLHALVFAQAGPSRSISMVRDLPVVVVPHRLWPCLHQLLDRSPYPRLDRRSPTHRPNSLSASRIQRRRVERAVCGPRPGRIEKCRARCRPRASGLVRRSPWPRGVCSCRADPPLVVTSRSRTVSARNAGSRVERSVEPEPSARHVRFNVRRGKALQGNLRDGSVVSRRSRML